MSIFPKPLHGYYDEDGSWIRTKFCFSQCPPEVCDCMPEPLKDIADEEWDSITKGMEK